MALALGGPLLLYSLQELKDGKHDVTSNPEKRDASFPAPVQPPSEATSIPSFVQSVQHPPLHSSPLFVTSIEWRAEPWKQLYYEYAVIYASTSVQAAPTIAIRVDRHGKLGLKVPWWHIRPIYFFANTKRTATSVLARPVGDPITDPITGTSIVKYTHWTHALPPSAPVLDLKLRSKVALSWGINKTENQSCLFVQLLTGSLSNYAFVSPHPPAARLTDVVSRLDPLAPIIPASGPARELCRLHADTLLARLPDKLWHAYTVSTPSVPPSKTYQTWRRIRNNSLFSLLLDTVIQWFIALMLFPQDGPEGLWVTCTVFYHVICVVWWAFREHNTWGKVWKVYEGGIIQGEDDTWDESGSLSSSWSRSKVSLLRNKWDSTYEIPLSVL
ncbi:hypothetical protein FS749_009106 [Ceratobasidium sp. UAMH 11750]|nr:hypothetical protein FS749_009106 [Ceratobasidium sp. UAMH 11750]